MSDDSIKDAAVHALTEGLRAHSGLGEALAEMEAEAFRDGVAWAVDWLNPGSVNKAMRDEFSADMDDEIQSRYRSNK